MSIRLLPILLVIALAVPCATAIFEEHATRTEELQAFLEDEAQPALDYVFDLLAERDLLLFDDALHDAIEPWSFYRELIRDPRSKGLDVIFLEVLATSDQPHLDAFLSAPEPDLKLLYPAFRHDLNGGGWPLQTYLDLFLEVHTVNQKRSADRKLRVIGVSNPVYWKGLVEHDQYKSFRRVVDLNRDHTMYRIILDEMGGFDEGRKSIFLTNTRHAYKAIRNGQGELYWNTGTFFHEHHPGRSASVRFHAPQLFLELDPQTGSRKVHFGRLEDGAWDEAFATYGQLQIAIPLNHGPFGAADYVGNHMLNSLAGQSMSDAYDGVIFLVPIETIRRAARTAAIFDASMRRELERRLPIVFGPRADAVFQSDDPAERVEEWIKLRDPGPHPLAQLPPL